MKIREEASASDGAIVVRCQIRVPAYCFGDSVLKCHSHKCVIWTTIEGLDRES
jgi:hypothetical protein